MLPATMSPPALKGLAIATTLLLAGCRGRGSEPAGGSLERDAAILTARTLGLAYLQSEQLAQAETAFSKIVALAPDQALGYANLGLVHLRLGRYDVAEREIRRAAARDTASDDIALTLAKVYELTGRTVEARHEVDRVLRRSPDDLRALYELAALDPASKETYLRRIVGRAPNNVAARLELGDGLGSRGAADARTIAAAIRFSDVTTTVGLGGVPPLPDTAGDVALAIGDYDRDGAEDVFVGAHLFHNELAHATETTDRAGIRLRDRAGGAVAATFGDYDGDGLVDLVVVGNDGRLTLFRNAGQGRFEDATAASGLTQGGAQGHAAAVAVGDYDNDGFLDLFVASAGGTAPVLYHNRGDGTFESDRRSAAFATLGTLAARAALFFDYDNNRFGIGATLELRAGKLYQSRVVTGPVTHFGLGQRLKADVLRVRWPNGVAQTVYYPGTDADILEQQILKGSCPFLYAWDGTAFRFVTDVMWRSALGMPLGIMAGGTDIASAPPHASREYMRIPGRALAPRNGRYVLQLTEELWETAYLDQAKLLAVDHPDSVDVYVDEGFVPPAPGPAALRLYPVSHPRPPVSATDEHGTDWLPALRARDDRYVAPLTLTRYQGLATLHDLILDLGDLKGLESDSVYLFLAGWIYPTDASINIALAQSGKPGVVFPYLEVKDAQGRWRRVADVPFPSGKNKTVIVDLTGKFLSADHHVRIRTNMEIYWDQAFVAAARSRTSSSITALDPATADLHYRGFSRLYRKGGRYGPEWAVYEDVSRESPWEPIVGRYTRYGDVLPLVRAPDDMYVIIAPGDETTLTFDASAAPPLPPGWTRDFLLYTDAWLKDSDRNTAMGATVAPLPFHGMSRYPYGADEAYPTDAAHTRYLETYNTRGVEILRSRAFRALAQDDSAGRLRQKEQ